MKIDANVQSFTAQENERISLQVQSDLADHLYKSGLSGIISGFLASWALFYDMYGQVPANLLLLWITSFQIVLLMFSVICYLFINHKYKYSLKFWEVTFFVLLSICALLWGLCAFIMPHEIARQYVAITFLFGNLAAYAIATIGQFFMCIATLSFMAIPMVIWCFIKGGLYYNIIGSYLIIYLLMVSGLNRRSTVWLVDYLRFRIQNLQTTYQANHDVLTDLPNQRLLVKFVDSAIIGSKESATEFSIISLSLNRIELINESLGYNAGDIIMLTLTKRLLDLKTEILQKDPDLNFLIALSRKDVFTLILSPTTKDLVETHVGFIASLLNKPFEFAKEAINITCSIGICTYPNDGIDREILLAKADLALLKAKKFGGNRVEYTSQDSHKDTSKAIKLENRLYKALSMGELEVYYQPIVDVATGQLSSAEALLRWNHKYHGQISPVEFIPIAEEIGLIVPIGEWVLNEVCKKISTWHQMGFSKLKVSVNIASKQLYKNDFHSVIRKALTDNNIEPKFLELELTENIIMDQNAESKIANIKSIGVQLSIDDFGTGYAGLSYLKRFDVDRLKIDKSFIDDITTDPDSNAIVSAIIAMAKALDLKTVAEGVETLEQLTILREKKCDFIQGYYYSRPINAVDFLALLQRGKTIY